MQARTTSGLGNILDDAKNKIAEFRLYGPRIEAALRKAEWFAQEMGQRGTQLQSNAAQVAVTTLLDAKGQFGRTWEKIEQLLFAIERTDISAASVGLLADAGAVVASIFAVQNKTKGAELILADLERQTGERAPTGLSPVAQGTAVMIGLVILFGIAQAARRSGRRR